MSHHIQFVSDLHLECLEPNTPFIKTVITPCAPLLAVLGDLSNPLHPNFKFFFDYYTDKFEKIFYVPGNHDYYCKGMVYDDVRKLIDNICSSYTNVICLNDRVHELDDQTVILGTELWTEIDKVQFDYAVEDDYMYIYSSPNVLAIPKFITKLHNNSVQWLEKTLPKYSNKNIVVLTHHMPSFQMIHPQFRNSPIHVVERHASNLDELIKKYPGIKFWLCGHTHVNMQEVIGNCICITNPCGYVGQNAHNPKAVIKIG